MFPQPANHSRNHLLQNPSTIFWSGWLQSSCCEVENGAKGNGYDSAHKTYDIIRHTEVRSRKRDQDSFCVHTQNGFTAVTLTKNGSKSKHHECPCTSTAQNRVAHPVSLLPIPICNGHACKFRHAFTDVNVERNSLLLTSSKHREDWT